MSEPTDTELLAEVRSGNADAYGTLWARHEPAARRLARQLARSADVDDLVSESFLRVLRAIQGGGGPDGAFRTYLLSTMRRFHLDTARGYHQRVALTDEPDELEPRHSSAPAAEQIVTEQLEHRAAWAAWLSLPAESRELLWQLVVDEETPAAIAPLLGISANAVASRAVRAKERLRSAFLEQYLADCPEGPCRETRAKFGGYVRKTLSDRDRIKVDEHLDDCDRCVAALLDISDTHRALVLTIAPLVLGGAGIAAAYLTAGHGSATVTAATSAPAGSSAGSTAGGSAGARTPGSALPAPTMVAAATVIAVSMAASAWALVAKSEPEHHTKQAGISATVRRTTGSPAGASGVPGSGGGALAAPTTTTPSGITPAPAAAPVTGATAPSGATVRSSPIAAPASSPSAVGPSGTTSLPVILPTTAPTTGGAETTAPAPSSSTPEPSTSEPSTSDPTTSEPTTTEPTTTEPTASEPSTTEVVTPVAYTFDVNDDREREPWVDLAVPDGWQITSVTNGDGTTPEGPVGPVSEGTWQITQFTYTVVVSGAGATSPVLTVTTSAGTTSFATPR